MPAKKSKMPMHKMPGGKMMTGKSHPMPQAMKTKMKKKMGSY